jgi:hypothetical protein
VILVTDPWHLPWECSYIDNSSERKHKVFRITKAGQQVFVASFDTLDEAGKPVVSLNGCWPGDYSIQAPDSLMRVVPSQKLSIPPDKRAYR